MSCLDQISKQITKEQYDEIMQESNGRGFVPDSIKHKYFSPSVLYGYGLYGTKVYEENGKYILWYQIGTTCD